ncbi:MAG: iron-sulfur cluster insertion protein ErpA [bacterium]|nr:iron-sulfur cluster insertion protein ErpA [bacterium]
MCGSEPVRRHHEARQSTKERSMITLTPEAASKVGELLTQEGEEGLALRVAVRPGGCSGFSYEMFFDTEVNDDDQSAEFEGVDVIVDRSSAMLLQGATLDYSDSLQNAGFSIDNPNAQRTCGCGQSFS